MTLKQVAMYEALHGIEPIGPYRDDANLAILGFRIVRALSAEPDKIKVEDFLPRWGRGKKRTTKVKRVPATPENIRRFLRALP